MDNNKLDYGILITGGLALLAFFKDNLLELLKWASGRKKDKAEESKAQAETNDIKEVGFKNAAVYWEEQANKERLAKDEEKRKNAEHLKKIDELEAKLREIQQELTLMRVKMNTNR